MIKTTNLLFFFIVTLCFINVVHCWDSREMQMFDLVEELKENFYDYLGISQNATINEIGKAYRKLTLRYHPDKNPGVENAKKFRHLVTIYEILKDEQLRERYHDILKFGLPDWRTSTFYYRKLRKMPIFEIIALFSLLSTLIHYACLWGVYFEKKLNMEEGLNKIFRRRRVQDRKKGKDNTEITINKTLKTIPKPCWKDILPLVLLMFIYTSIVSIPQNIKLLFGLLKHEATTAIDKKFEKQRKLKAKEEERKKLDEMKKQKKERKIALSKEQLELRRNYELAKKNAMVLPIETFCDLPSDIGDNRLDGLSEEDNIDLGPWTDEHTVLLIKALTKFPAGVRDRWLRIGELVKRPVVEVTGKVKEIQQKSREGKVPINQKMQSRLGEGVAELLDESSCSDQQRVMYIADILENTDEVSTSTDDESTELRSKAQLKKDRKKLAKQNCAAVGITKPLSDKELGATNDNETVCGEEGKVDAEIESVLQQRKKPRTKASYLEAETAEPIDCVWNQAEQKQLEDAMRALPNGTSNRWDRIAQRVPTKTKAECIDRIKRLSQAVQSKQTTTEA